jgi:hypothetical protein
MMTSGQNTHLDVRVEVCNTLDIQTEVISDKYLGLPTMVGMGRSDCFKYLIERVQKSLVVGRRKFYPWEEMKCFLKPVAQAM